MGSFHHDLLWDLHYYRTIVEREEEEEEVVGQEGEGEQVERGQVEGVEVIQEEEEEQQLGEEEEDGGSGSSQSPKRGGRGGGGMDERTRNLLEYLNRVDDDEEEDEKGVGSRDDLLVHSIQINHPPENKFRFCPWCSNLIQVHHNGGRKSGDAWRWKCVTCPYILPVTRQHRYVTFTQKHLEEEEDQIVETAKANEHRQRTEVLCPSCDHKEAFFYQMQTRSADEPMTTFYECCNRSCGHHWRD